MHIKRKLRVGILTFHYGINHGSYLQSYALFKTLENLGHNVEIINYGNFMRRLREYKVFLITKNIKTLINNMRKIRKFKKSHKKFKLGKPLFTHKEVQRKHYDAIVIGSDEVWNFNNPLFNFNYDPIYFGHNLSVNKIIAYAPSFGNVSVKSKVPQGVIEGLKRFNAVSVRDENSQRIIEKILGYKPDIVLDPTFLYNFDGEEIEPPYKNYILVYATGLKQKYIEKLKEFGRKQNKKIISIGYKNNWCSINVITLDPFEWLGYFKNADYVITNTFHGSIYSVIYKKQFISIPHRSKKNKIMSFAKLLSLKNIFIDGDLSLLLNKRVEYDKVIEKIDFLQKKSIKYLMENLNK